MPFINTKTTIPLTDEKKERLTAGISRITCECLGKGESWVMTGYEDNACLSFQGSSSDAAYIEVKSFGAPSAGGCREMTSKLSAFLTQETGIPSDRIYIAYFPTDLWGWNGNNF